MLLAGWQYRTLPFDDLLDGVEGVWLDSIAVGVDHAKALAELDQLAEEALVPFDEWGESDAALARQDAMMEQFPSALPFDEE